MSIVIQRALKKAIDRDNDHNFIQAELLKKDMASRSMVIHDNLSVNRIEFSDSMKALIEYKADQGLNPINQDLGAIHLDSQYDWKVKSIDVKYFSLISETHEVLDGSGKIQEIAKLFHSKRSITISPKDVLEFVDTQIINGNKEWEDFINQPKHKRWNIVLNTYRKKKYAAKFREIVGQCTPNQIQKNFNLDKKGCSELFANVLNYQALKKKELTVLESAFKNLKAD